MDIISCPSLNFDDRAGGQSPSMIILHYTGTRTAEEARDIFASPEASGDYGRVSPHYMIDGQARVYRFVNEEKRAWHAGRAAWGDVTDINSASIGIEIWNTGHEFDLEDFLPAQIETLKPLIADIRSRWMIPDRNILGHSDVAPGRKLDPGEKFPWQNLAAAGIGIMPRAGSLERAASWSDDEFWQRLREFGYTYTDEKSVLLQEFRRHYVPSLLGAEGLQSKDICALFDISAQISPY